ncbi:hypothetical protein ACLKA6_013764 [Drosophila palustris]
MINSENHKVTTDDGFIITVHRIPLAGAVPVLLMHGLFDASPSWVMQGPTKGLGYLLHDRGYDVWLGNTRGNTYGREHKFLKQHQDEFWDYSFHEIGIFDIPNTIDYILNQTGYSQLQYISHSQGCTSFFVMGSERPEYMSKIISMHAMAPVAFFEHTKSPVMKFLGEAHRSAIVLNKYFGTQEFLPKTAFTDMFSQQLCGSDRTKPICSNVLFLTTGFNSEQLNMTMLPVYIAHAPAGASTKQVMHFGQVRSLEGLRKFDYGRLQNLRRYNTLTPPEYNLWNVRAKVSLYYGQNDWLAQPGDAKLLLKKLPNVVYDYLSDYPKFNHLDFIWGIDSWDLIWERIYNNMQSHDLPIRYKSYSQLY